MAEAAPGAAPGQVVAVKRILIAGGGTGGHLYPGLAVAEALKDQKPETEIMFVGTRRGIETRVVPGAGYPLKLMSVRGLPRSPSWGWVSFWFSLLKGLVEAWNLVRSWKPAVIVGTGGYASVPTAWVGLVMRIPVVLLEQNRIPGLASRAIAPWAECVCLNYEDSSDRFIRKGNLRTTGNPVRRQVAEGPRRSDESGFVKVLVFGGSRGAHQVNELLAGALAQLPASLPVEFLVQTGTDDREWVEERLRESGFGGSVQSYIDEMGEAYADADLVVCRAGATTLAEITARGLPSILVPYPHATAGHQEANAGVLVKHGAAEMLNPKRATAGDLADVIRRLVEDRRERERMAARAKAMGRTGAAAEVAEIVHSLAEGTVRKA
ncbi:MAG: undecaprenyldiphospho-muramoylpentapeptide beta-N-acetylglucosaminyltransferase [Candidatus Eisenbacteria sp.]|nr:undecaprenyldiphospho-muramoylpentapeptide beta-N-acetylglucosaminyltransferase [Candidatus Eisenbacteria bacterium]